MKRSLRSFDIENPDFYVEEFVNAIADLIVVHYETCPHLHRSIQK